MNDEKCYNMASQSIKKIVGETNYLNKDFGLAGEDFSFFTQ